MKSNLSETGHGSFASCSDCVVVVAPEKAISAGRQRSDPAPNDTVPWFDRRGHQADEAGGRAGNSPENRVHQSGLD